MNAYYTELDIKDIVIGQQEKHLSAKQLKDIPMFFIVGRPRSGTTLLKMLFDAHPNIIVPTECQLIINLYPKYGKITKWSIQDLDSFYKDLFRQWYFNIWPINKEHLYESLMACEGEHSYSTICKVVYHEYRSLFKCNLLLAIGDKNPGYTIYTKELLKIFPEARFIHIVRDYRDNFISIRNVDFELPIISVTVSKWKNFVRKFRKEAARHPGTHLEIRYEDLASQPEEAFKELCEFVGIPFSTIPFDFYKTSGDALNIYPKQLVLKYHTNLLKKINTSRIDLWKKELTESEIRIADVCAGKYAELTGHKKLYAKPGIKAWLRSLPGKGFASLLAITTRIVDRMPYNIRRNILNRAPLIVGRFYLSIFNKKKLREIDNKIKSIQDQAEDNQEEINWRMANDSN